MAFGGCLTGSLPHSGLREGGNEDVATWFQSHFPVLFFSGQPPILEKFPFLGVVQMHISTWVSTPSHPFGPVLGCVEPRSGDIVGSRGLVHAVEYQVFKTFHVHPFHRYNAYMLSGFLASPVALLGKTHLWPNFDIFFRPKYLTPHSRLRTYKTSKMDTT